jgi:phosphoglycolate phosphatase
MIDLKQNDKKMELFNAFNMKKEKIIIFDFDGVIADSFEIAFAVNKIFRPTITRESYRKLFDGNIYDALLQWPAEKEIDFFAEYGERFKALGINSTVTSIIKELSGNFRLFINSGTADAVIYEYLKRHGTLDYFVEILGCDVETNKVKKFNTIFKKYKVLPDESIFITDTAGDIKEAQEAKINFIVGILGGYQSRESLEKAQPNAIAEDFNDFFDIVQE